MNQPPLKSPLNRVNYLGCAHNGTTNFWHQRLTSFALIFLGIWFVYALFTQLPSTYLDVLAWVKRPVTTCGLLALIIVMIYHAQLGLQVIIEDYVHHQGVRFILFGFLKILSFALICIAMIMLTRIQIMHISPIVDYSINRQGH